MEQCHCVSNESQAEMLEKLTGNAEILVARLGGVGKRTEVVQEPQEYHLLGKRRCSLPTARKVKFLKRPLPGASANYAAVLLPEYGSTVDAVRGLLIWTSVWAFHSLFFWPLGAAPDGLHGPDA